MTPTPNEKCSLVIPAYNEEERITPLFDAITGFEGELIVVCDGTDGTADVVDRIATLRKDLNIHCLRFDHRLGKGGGVIAGLMAARLPLVGYFDADGSTGIDEMERLFLMLSAADGAIGSRWVPGCGAKVFKKSAIDAVLPKIISRGFEFDVELLWRLNRAGFRVIEVPIAWQNKEDSHVRKSDMIRMLSGLFWVRFGSKKQ
jgi:dolichol-phosphate mannosyltransferase